MHFELRDNGRWIDPAPYLVGYRDMELNGPLVALSAQAQAQASAGDAPPVPAEARAHAANEEAHGRDREHVHDRAVDAARPEPPAPSAHEREPALPLVIGTIEAARRLEHSSPPHIADEGELGRRFSNLLFPLKGGRQARAFDPAQHRAVDLAGEASAAVRAAADGVVVYSGPGLAAHGHTIVLWHRGGWVTLYGCVRAEGAAEAGAHVQRGEWIGHVGACEAGAASTLHFEWFDHGERRDPGALFVGR
jgi:murein DD-endopeptidase MepM/ murein hydrolase activator NlpD